MQNWSDLLHSVETIRAASADRLLTTVALSDGTVIHDKATGQQTLDDLDEVLVWLNHLASEKELADTVAWCPPNTKPEAQEPRVPVLPI